MVSLRSQYRKSWSFILESRWFVVSAFALFCLSFLVGFVFPVFFVDQIKVFIEEMVASLSGLSTGEVILYILWNNMKAAFFAVLLGIGLGVFPLVTTVINGYLLGFVSRAAAHSEGIFVFWRILPHGVFELPAILFSIGLGLKVGLSVFGRSRRSVRENVVESLRVFVFIIIPLLVIAAVIEGFLVAFLN